MPIPVEGAAGTFTTVGPACLPTLGASGQLTGGSSTGRPFLLCMLYIQVLKKLLLRFEAQGSCDPQDENYCSKSSESPFMTYGIAPWSAYFGDQACIYSLNNIKQVFPN